MYEGVTPLIKEIIELNQPYSGVYTTAGDLLRELHMLNIIDKHRSLIEGMMGYYDGTYNVHGGEMSMYGGKYQINSA
jgi:hypothetical protein